MIRYTCVGKGGEYEYVGIAKGAGTNRDQTIVVYRNASTGALYHRTIEDFDVRMQRIPPGSQADMTNSRASATAAPAAFPVLTTPSSIRQAVDQLTLVTTIVQRAQDRLIELLHAKL